MEVRSSSVSIVEPTEISFSDLCGFFPAQWSATEAADAHTFTLYGGAKGPGKSYWLRWYALRFLLRLASLGYSNVRVMLASESYPTLYERHIVKISTEFPPWLGEYFKGDKEFRLFPQYGGGAIALRNLDDVEKYGGAEFALIAVDELTRNPKRTFDLLLGALRWPGLEDVRFIAASNPTGIGKKWTRELFLEKKLPEGSDYGPDEYVFVPARPGDNPFLTPAYWNMLKTLDEPLRRAWIEGDWYVSFEGLVYQDFGEDNLLAPDWTPLDPDRFEVEIGFDDGYVDPRAILFVQRTGSDLFVFDEIYESRRTSDEAIDAIYDRMIAHFGPLEERGEPVQDESGRIVPRILPAISAGSPEAKELQVKLRRANIPVTYKPHRIVEGISHVRGLIKDGKGYRTIKVHPRCSNLISEISEGYVYPPEGSRRDDETPLDANNHAMDALRYYAWSRVPLRGLS